MLWKNNSNLHSLELYIVLYSFIRESKTLTSCCCSSKCCLSFALQGHQHEINPFSLQEFFMSSPLHSPSVLEPNDDISSFDSRQAVSYRDCCAAKVSLTGNKTSPSARRAKGNQLEPMLYKLKFLQTERSLSSGFIWLWLEFYPQSMYYPPKRRQNQTSAKSTAYSGPLCCKNLVVIRQVLHTIEKSVLLDRDAAGKILTVLSILLLTSCQKP